MTTRAHAILRGIALLLIAGVALWPRSERFARDHHVAVSAAVTQVGVAHVIPTVVTTGARLADAPRLERALAHDAPLASEATAAVEADDDTRATN